MNNCKTCGDAEWKCKPPDVACICGKKGIGIRQECVEVLGVVGCLIYSYDGKGLTDLERSFYKKR